MKIILRKEAKELNLVRYYTGNPCKYGHLAERYTGDRKCVICHKEHSADRNNRNKQRYKEDKIFRKKLIMRASERTKQRYEGEPIFRKKMLLYGKEWRNKHREYCCIKRKEYREENLNKCKELIRDWWKNNLNMRGFYNSNRRALRIKATPIWADMEKIKKIYIEAIKNKMVVDHIIPLKSKYVCGLHVENNLQLLIAEENSKKNNKFKTGGVLSDY